MPLTAVSAVGVGVVLVAWAFVGAEGLEMALMGVLAALIITVVSEFSVAMANVELPVFRMLMTMLTRAFGAVLVIGAAAASGCEPVLIAMIATPLYLGMVAAETYDAVHELQLDKTTTEHTTAGA